MCMRILSVRMYVRCIDGRLQSVQLQPVLRQCACLVETEDLHIASHIDSVANEEQKRTHTDTCNRGKKEVSGNHNRQATRETPLTIENDIYYSNDEECVP